MRCEESRSWPAVRSKPVFEVRWRALGSEDRCLLCRELLLRDDALVFSLRELPKLLEHVSAHGGCSRR
jgi:hypothetical protein